MIALVLINLAVELLASTVGHLATASAAAATGRGSDRSSQSMSMCDRCDLTTTTVVAIDAIIADELRLLTRSSFTEGHVASDLTFECHREASGVTLSHFKEAVPATTKISELAASVSTCETHFAGWTSYYASWGEVSCCATKGAFAAVGQLRPSILTAGLTSRAGHCGNCSGFSQHGEDPAYSTWPSVVTIGASKCYFSPRHVVGWAGDPHGAPSKYYSNFVDAGIAATSRAHTV